MPKGSTYILQWIIHDRHNRHSEAILEKCCAAMSNGGRILIIESVIQPDPANCFSKFMDLATLTRLVASGIQMSVIEAQRA